jgi:hypothetical protein
MTSVMAESRGCSGFSKIVQVLAKDLQSMERTERTQHIRSPMLPKIRRLHEYLHRYGSDRVARLLEEVLVNPVCRQALERSPTPLTEWDPIGFQRGAP